jgi:hypothetical protein
MAKVEELTQHQRDILAMGKCPFCEAPIRGYRPPSGSFAPEMWASLRERGIDPASGHRKCCAHKDITVRG